MNIEQLRKELEVDEGVKYEIYKDHLGYPTFGIGHLVIDYLALVVGNFSLVLGEESLVILSFFVSFVHSFIRPFGRSQGIGSCT